MVDGPDDIRSEIGRMNASNVGQGPDARAQSDLQRRIEDLEATINEMQRDQREDTPFQPDSPFEQDPMPGLIPGDGVAGLDVGRGGRSIAGDSPFQPMTILGGLKVEWGIPVEEFTSGTTIELDPCDVDGTSLGLESVTVHLSVARGTISVALTTDDVLSFIRYVTPYDDGGTDVVGVLVGVLGGGSTMLFGEATETADAPPPNFVWEVDVHPCEGIDGAGVDAGTTHTVYLQPTVTNPLQSPAVYSGDVIAYVEDVNGRYSGVQFTMAPVVGSYMICHDMDNIPTGWAAVTDAKGRLLRFWDDTYDPGDTDGADDGPPYTTSQPSDADPFSIDTTPSAPDSAATEDHTHTVDPKVFHLGLITRTS